MEAYKRWVRRNKEYVHSLESLANGLTWLLPERFSDSEIIPEAGLVIFCIVANVNVTSMLGIMTTVNEHIIETTPSHVHTKPQEPSSFPYSLCLTLMKDMETLVEVMAEQFYGDDNKWKFIAVTEATNFIANSGYKMLLQGGETINNGKDADDANQQQTYGHLLQQGQNGNFTPAGRALSALNRFGENARMISNPTWFQKVEHHQHEIIELPGELMFIARPLVSVLLIRKYGPRSWIPWFISLTIDLIGMSSSTTLLTHHFDRKLHLSNPGKDEAKIGKYRENVGTCPCCPVSHSKADRAFGWSSNALHVHVCIHSQVLVTSSQLSHGI
ncbi:hypothetical protein L1987_76858 [Smallanthus sonchifolius]|uniref:Uncharacterized protein n=1 Tax=Smallanthus sonchifolius TaxID=185202 RepID=A0ACB8Z989_9ASTR|nr:hypothetical protein L1987_76858 [Smallanthus sonchifolius]